MLSEQGINQVSFWTSLLLHVLLMVIMIPVSVDKKIKSESKIEVPIQMTILEKPSPKPQPAVSKPKPVPRPKKALTPKPAPKPKSVPVAQPKPEPTPEPEPEPVYLNDREFPEVSSSISPVYPKQAINNEWAGTVSVIFEIDEFGVPYSYRVVSSSGHEILDQSFVRTVMKYYSFKPKVVKDVAQKSTIKLTHSFKWEEAL